VVLLPINLDWEAHGKQRRGFRRGARAVGVLSSDCLQHPLDLRNRSPSSRQTEQKSIEKVGQTPGLFNALY
jgi:hypothetical protein